MDLCVLSSIFTFPKKITISGHLRMTDMVSFGTCWNGYLGTPAVHTRYTHWAFPKVSFVVPVAGHLAKRTLTSLPSCWGLGGSHFSCTGLPSMWATPEVLFQRHPLTTWLRHFIHSAPFLSSHTLGHIFKKSDLLVSHFKIFKKWDKGQENPTSFT